MTKTRNRMCTGKRRHATKAEAEDAMWRLIRAGARPSRVNVYVCKHCGFFHVGHVGRRR